MSNVYTVEAGEYSDYQVFGVFSTKENAQKYIDFLTKHGEGRPYDIIERVLDMPDPYPECYIVYIDREGNVKHAYWQDYNPLPPRQGWGDFIGYGKTVEHARRSAEELRRQTLVLEGFAKDEHEGYNVFNPIVEDK